MSKSVDEQIEDLDKNIADEWASFECDLYDVLRRVHTGADNFNSNDMHMSVSRIKHQLDEVVKNTAVKTLLGLLTHPERFAAMTALAARIDHEGEIR